MNNGLVLVTAIGIGLTGCASGGGGGGGGGGRTASDLLASALDANLTQVSLRQNEDMRKISAWVAMAAVPTMVAGIYGMNFTNMPELEWTFGYPLVVTLTAIAVALLYRQFKKSGWL